jgi:hypothetical protein
VKSEERVTDQQKKSHESKHEKAEATRRVMSRGSMIKKKNHKDLSTKGHEEAMDSRFFD